MTNATGVSVGRRSKSSRIPSVLDGSLFVPPGGLPPSDTVCVPPSTAASLPNNLESTYLAKSLDPTYLTSSLERPTTTTNPTLLRRMSTQTHYSYRPTPPLSTQRSRTSLNTQPDTTRHMRRTSYSHAEAALRSSPPTVEVRKCGRFTLTREVGCHKGMGHRRRDSGSRFVVVRDGEGDVKKDGSDGGEKEEGKGKRGRFVVVDGVDGAGKGGEMEGEDDKNGTMNTVRSADSGVVV